jgi:hypothetical protein
MIFRSHFISMIIFSLIVSVVMAFIKFDDKKAILKYGLKLFLYMTVGVIAFSWFMHFL